MTPDEKIMEKQLDLSQPMEVRDATGHPVAVLSAKQFVEELKGERDRLSEEVNRLRSEVRRLQTELKETAAERDEYLSALKKILGDNFAFTPEELADMERNGLSLEYIIQELEKMP